MQPETKEFLLSMFVVACVLYAVSVAVRALILFI